MPMLKNPFPMPGELFSQFRPFAQILLAPILLTVWLLVVIWWTAERVLLKD